MKTPERLRALADWFEKHPDAEVPYSLSAGYSYMNMIFPSQLEETIKAIGSFDKSYDDYHFNMVVKIGDVSITYYTERNAVCTPKIVGKKQVEQQVIPSTFYPEKVIPAHEEDIIEWECPESILEKKNHE